MVSPVFFVMDFICFNQQFDVFHSCACFEEGLVVVEGAVDVGLVHVWCKFFIGCIAFLGANLDEDFSAWRQRMTIHKTQEIALAKP